MRKIDEINKSALFTYSFLSRKLAVEPLSIFATDRCNSRCRMCNIWKKKPKIDLPPEIVETILKDKVLSKWSSFILTGGEVILHPKCREILSLFNESKKRYTLLSNGLLATDLVSLVREFHVKNLSISLDGSPETYKEVRGVDGYSKVEGVIEELRDDDLTLSVGYTVNPWNCRDDLIHVIKFCEKHRVNLSIGYYCNVGYYESSIASDKLYSVSDLVKAPYHKLYSFWASGNLTLPCFSVFLKPVIRPNGDVELCEPRQVKLGNLYEKSLSDIWLSKRTRMLQRQYSRCNACWHDAQRPCDIWAFSVAKSFVPWWMMSRMFAGYDWRKIYQILN